MPTLPKPELKKTKQGELILTNVRTAYPDLYEAVPFKNDPKNAPRYGVTVLIPKTEEEIVSRLQAYIAKMAQEVLKVPNLPEADSCLRDGDNNSNENYHGNMVLSLYSYPSDKMDNKGAPRVVDMVKRDIRRDAENAPYSGCYANVMFDFYPPKGWKKISGGLRVFQKTNVEGDVIGFKTDMSEMPSLPEEELAGDEFGI